MIDPQIALQVRPPAPPESPIKSFGDLMQIRDIASQVQLRQAQTEHAKQQAAEQQAIADAKRRDINDQRLIQQTMANPDYAKAIGSGDLSVLHGKVTPTALFGLQKTITDTHKDAAALDETTLKNNAARHAEFERTIDGLMQLPETERAGAYQSALETLGAAGLTKGMNIPAQVDTSDQGLRKLAAMNGVYGSLYQTALNRKKEEAGIGLTQAQTTEAGATTAQKQAEAAKTQQATQVAQRQQIAGQLAAAAEQGPEQYKAVLDQLPDEHRGVFEGVTNPKMIRFLGMSPEQQIQSIQQEARLAHEQNTAAETARHNRSEEGLAGGRLAVERQREGREQQIYQQTYGEGANPALVGVEPKLRSQAVSAAQKAANEHTAATAAADEMKSIIDLAKSGNKVAYAYAPTTGVLTINTGTGVKRVNMAEIKQYEGAGSLVDKLTGTLGKAISGASIPANILSDMSQLHSTLAGTADRAYNDKINSINQNYRSNFQPVGAAKAAGGSGGPKVGTVEGGYRFKGGNPADKSNWEKVQ
jgi:hypothetical protein